MPVFDTGQTVMAGAAHAGNQSGSVDIGDDVTGKSLVFNNGSSHYLTKTPSGAGDKMTWTISLWLKRSTTGVSHMLWDHGTTHGTNTFTDLYFGSDDTITFYHYTGSTVGNFQTTRKFRDTSAWYHIHFVCDTTNASADKRARLYINGVEETSFASTTNMPIRTETYMNGTGEQRIGEYMG